MVVTSRFAAVFDPMHGLRPGYEYRLEDWLSISCEAAAGPNLDVSVWPFCVGGFITYMVGKKLAKDAAGVCIMSAS